MPWPLAAFLIACAVIILFGAGLIAAVWLVSRVILPAEPRGDTEDSDAKVRRWNAEAQAARDKAITDEMERQLRGEQR